MAFSPKNLFFATCAETMRQSVNYNETQRKEVIKMEETTPILHAVSKEGRPYECIEVKLGDTPVGRIFPRPLEMAAIKNALGHA